MTLRLPAFPPRDPAIPQRRKRGKRPIVDDEPNIRRMVGALLSGEGYDIREAANGAQGLSRAAESEPDAILLDLMMPGELTDSQRCRGFASRTLMCLSS